MTLTDKQKRQKRNEQNNWSILSLLGFLVIFVFSNTIFGHFVSDDISIIVENPSVGVFTRQFAQPYVFMKSLLNFLMYSIGGGNPAPFHILNIAFHIGSVYLLYFIVRFLHNKRTAIFASVLFAIHPIISEPVTWISGGVYVQYSFFLLASFLLFIIHTELPNKRYYMGSLILFLLALLTSEKSIVYPGILFLFLISYSRFRKHWKDIIPYGILSLIWVAIYFSQYTVRVQLHNYSFGNTAYIENPVFLIATAFTTYLRLIFWPDVLTIFHSEFLLNTVNTVLIWLGFGLLLSILIVSFMKKRSVFFWLSFFMLSLAITVLPLKISWIVAERYVYLGSSGIFVCVGILLNHLIDRKRYVRIIYSSFIVIVCLLMIRTIVRNKDWQTEEKLWTATVKSTPTNSVAHNSLGNVYRSKNDLPKAANEFHESIVLNPSYAEGYYNLADVYRLANQFDNALEYYQKSVKLNPTLWQSYQAIGAVYYLRKNYPQAITNTKKAIALQKNNPELYINIGIMYYESGDKDEAQQAFENALNIDPTNNKAQLGLQRVINSR